MIAAAEAKTAQDRAPFPLGYEHEFRGLVTQIRPSGYSPDGMPKDRDLAVKGLDFFQVGGSCQGTADLSQFGLRTKTRGIGRHADSNPDNMAGSPGDCGHPSRATR